VLQVAVEGNNDVALRFVKAGGECGRLPEITAQPQHFQALIGFYQVREQIEASVGRRIVHKDDLVGAAQCFEHRGETVVQRQNRRFLIVNGDNYGQHFRSVYV
jgi:hypothetical protein